MPSMEKRRKTVIWIFPVLISLILAGEMSRKTLQLHWLFIFRLGKDHFKSVAFLVITTNLITDWFTNQLAWNRD